MRLTESRIEASPDRAGQVRLSATVRYQNPRLPAEDVYWFEVDRNVASDFSRRSSPWLTLLLPLAVMYHEPLEFPLPIDRQQYEGALRLMDIWSEWYPRMNLRPIPITGDIEDRRVGGRRRAAFFSGGIDSFFTVLDHPELDDLILIRGFDLPLQEQEAYDRVVDRLREAATELGKTLVPVRINFRETAQRLVDPMKLSAGGNLACVALALEKRWSAALVSAGQTGPTFRPSGTHPDTDILHSTLSTEICYVGGDHTRFEKTLAIAPNPTVQKFVRVCWVDQHGENCGACSKCVRSMLGFQLAGVLPSVRTFPRAHVTVDEVRNLYHPQNRQRHYIEELITAAIEYRQPELAQALEHSLKRSERINRWTRLEQVRAWAERLKNLHPEIYQLLYPARRLFHRIGERFLGNLWT